MQIQKAAARCWWLAPVVAVLLVGCISTGGHGSFLLFGGSDDSQAVLVERVRGAQAEAAAASQDFNDTFHLFQRVTAPQAVELEDLSDDFEDALEGCAERGEDLSERVAAIRSDAERLFNEWKADLEHFSGDALRKKSETMMLDTEERSQRVIAALESVLGRMQPVLLQLRDYALFFRHNLTARSIATLQDTYSDFDTEMQALDKELQQAQVELSSFLTAFEVQAAAQ